jgi:hypothetical protein
MPCAFVPIPAHDGDLFAVQARQREISDPDPVAGLESRVDIDAHAVGRQVGEPSDDETGIGPDELAGEVQVEVRPVGLPFEGTCGRADQLALDLVQQARP